MATLPRKTDRRNQKVIGRIDPDSLYTTEGCMRFGGLGLKELAEGRQAKVLHPVYRGRRAYYHGYELIEWCCAGETNGVKREESCPNWDN